MPEPVRKSITVRAGIERAFQVFTAGVDSWWPRTHHIGNSPMQKAMIEPRSGGRCYSEQQDGTFCDWGTVLVWEPPNRFVMAWQVTPEWRFEPDLARASEVEVRFLPISSEWTQVELEHRYLERHGAQAGAMRTALDSPGGWNGLLQLYGGKASEAE